MKLFKFEITRRLRRTALRPVKMESRVKGFTVSGEIKEGVLLTYEAKADKPERPASANAYYEIAVQSTGENPEYPASDNPMVVRFTIGLGSGYGMTGRVSYLPAGARYTGFEVVEEYNDGTLKPGFMGKLMPAHHSVMLRAHYRTAEGRNLNMAMGGWVRRSERERPEWRAAAASPVTYG